MCFSEKVLGVVWRLSVFLEIESIAMTLVAVQVSSACGLS